MHFLSASYITLKKKRLLAKEHIINYQEYFTACVSVHNWWICIDLPTRTTNNLSVPFASKCLQSVSMILCYTVPFHQQKNVCVQALMKLWVWFRKRLMCDSRNSEWRDMKPVFYCGNLKLSQLLKLHDKVYSYSHHMATDGWEGFSWLLKLVSTTDKF